MGLAIACGSLLGLAAPVALNAQFTYTTDNGTITITGYTGPGGEVSIPDTIDGLPVTSIGDKAFCEYASLTSVQIPNSVTSIGGGAFAGCTSLSSIAIPSSVTNIGAGAFDGCTSLASATIPDGVTSIWNCTFAFCTNLASVTIGHSVTNIDFYAFSCCSSLTTVTIPATVTYIARLAMNGCTSLTGIFFEGNVPGPGIDDPFGFDCIATVYYLPGTTGWGPTFGGLPTAPWVLPYPVILTAPLSFGVGTNGYGFVISWATNASVVVDACTDLANPTWSPAGTNALVEGWSYFSDPEWTNHVNRFYRLRSP